MNISRHIDAAFLSSFTKKAPVHRGFLGTGIVPTGELEGQEDTTAARRVSAAIVPTGELEGREDPPRVRGAGLRDCTNWGIGGHVRQSFD